MENVLLQASLYLSAAVIAVPLSQRLGLGSVLGYLLAGVLLSPLLHLIGSNTEQIQHYAEFGIVILLFLIGLELRPERLWAMRESLIGLGGLQILVTTAVITFISMQIGLVWQTSLAIALILSLSSTAIALQTLTEKRLQHTEGGKSATAILLMQDVVVIPMLAILPLLALQELQVDALIASVLSGEEIEEKSNSSSNISQLPGWITAIAIAGSIAVIVLSAKYLTEPIIKYISGYGTSEIFLAATFLLIISIAYLMKLVGLSPALGTFLVGLVLSNSKYRHTLASYLHPFKGLLLGLFFITVGAGINFSLLIENLILILTLTISLIFTKGLILFILAKIFLLAKHSSLLIALFLSQAGEFGFVLLSLAKTAHVIPPHLVENLALIITLSMLVTPLLFFLVQKVRSTDLLFKLDTSDERNKSLGRVILIGINPVGTTIHKILLNSYVDTIILGKSSSKIEMLRKSGVKAFYGDATNPKLLAKAGINSSEMVILTLENAVKSAAITSLILKKYPKVQLIVRAVNFEHYKTLYACGAREIILETRCCALELGKSALTALGEPSDAIDKSVKSLEFYESENNLKTENI